jgi:hypothetical protein
MTGFLPTATRNNFDESISNFARPDPEKFSFFDDNALPARADQSRPVSSVTTGKKFQGGSI